jgi:hypothetical protein
MVYKKNPRQIIPDIEFSRRYFYCKDLAAGLKAEWQKTESFIIVRLLRIAKSMKWPAKVAKDS